jgi:hypothetical protein
MFPPVFILICLDCILLGIVEKLSSVRPWWEFLNSECICFFVGLTASQCWLPVIFFKYIWTISVYVTHYNIHFIFIKIRINTKRVLTVLVRIMADCEPCLPNDWWYLGCHELTPIDPTRWTFAVPITLILTTNFYILQSRSKLSSN